MSLKDGEDGVPDLEDRVNQVIERNRELFDALDE